MSKFLPIATLTFASALTLAQAQTLQQDCDNNNAEACMQLGIQNQTVNRMASFKAYEKACSLGDAVGCYRAAFALNWNFGPDHICPSTARKFLRKSCKMGYQQACTDLVDIWKFWDP